MAKVRNPTKLTGLQTPSPSQAGGRELSSCNLAPKVPPALDSRACLRELGSGTRIVAGNAGDHAFVLQLLVEAYQCPLAEDFQSRLDEPSYKPSDRLLLQREQRLIGHVQMLKQIGWFQGQRCPLVKLQDFATLPEYRSADFEKTLLDVAESTAVTEGAILGLVQTDRPEWFEQHGWSCFRGQGYTRANTRAIL